MAKKFLYILALCLLAASCSKSSTAEQAVSVIPMPRHIELEEGEFTINKNTVLFLGDPSEEMQRIAAFLNQKFATAAGFTMELAEDQNGYPTQNAIFFMHTDGLKTESYNLHIEKGRIVIEYGDGAGAFYALQTLFQLLPKQILGDKVERRLKWSVPCGYIEDSPRFEYRGMHLDVCLHFFDLDFLKRYIDLMAFHKVNRFHWHLTEDQGWRIEIKKYPLLTEKGQWRKETVIGSLKSGFYDGTPHGGYYTQEEVKELVQYAAERYVTIIPEIELPGHALAAIACYPELSCGLEEKYETATKWGVFKQVYCPKEETFKFLEDVFDEVLELFPSEYIHIGGDECPKASWKKCPHCQGLIKKLGLKDEFELQSYFVSRMEKYLNSKGRSIIGWDEILQGGLAPNATVMSWLGEEGGIKAAQQKHKAIMAPYPKYYLDYWQADPDSEPLAMDGVTLLKTVYDYNPVPDVLTEEEKAYIYGVEACVWTEYLATPERVEYMAWPRMCAVAESGWSKGDKDYTAFTQRLENHFGRLDQLKVGYCKAFYNPMIQLHPDTKFNKIVTMSVDAPGAVIHYTLDGSTPTEKSPVYELPFSVNRSQIVSAVAYRNGKPIGDIKQKRFN